MPSGILYPFTSPSDGTLSARSVLPRAAGIACLYWKKPAELQRLVGLCGGGFFYAIEQDSGGVLPAYTIFRSGRYLHVWLAGTENLLPQLFPNHLAGALGVGYGNRGIVNAFFVQTADTLWPLIQARLADIADPILSLSGHSYGGGVAQVVGELATGNGLSDSQVECLTFGSPKTFDARHGSHFRDLRRVCAVGDPVPLLPPVGRIGLPVGDVSVSVEWTHYGTAHALDSDGLDTAGSRTVDVPPGASFTVPNLQRHSTRHYVTLLANEQQASGRGGFLDDVAQLGGGVVSAQPDQPLNIEFQSRPYLDPSALNTALFPRFPGLLNLALSKAAELVSGAVTLRRVNDASGDTVFGPGKSGTLVGGFGVMSEQIQLVVTYDDDAASWSENYFLVGDMTLDQAIARAKVMVKLRAKLLGAGVEVTALRVSSAIVQGDSKLVTGDDLRVQAASTSKVTSTTAVDDVADFQDKGVLLRFEADDFSRREAMLGGLPDGITHHRDHKVTDATWLKLFDAWVNEMCSGRWGYRALDRGATTNPPLPVTQLTNIVGPPENIELTVTAHGLLTNARVRVGGFKGSGVRPAGIYRVVRVDNNVLRLMGYEGNFSASVLGYVRPTKYVIRSFTNIQQMRFTTRRRKPSFFSPKPKLRKKSTR